MEIPTASSSRSHNSLSEETKEMVIKFYNTNAISWQAPGHKDRIIIREVHVNSESKKVKRTEQVCYMLVSLKETHNCFIKTPSEYKIGLSKFCDVMPKKVISSCLTTFLTTYVYAVTTKMSGFTTCFKGTHRTVH